MRGGMLWIKELRKKEPAVNMRRRLMVFLLLLMVTMLTGVMLLLTAFGVFPFGTTEAKKLFEKELYHLSDTAAVQYGKASAQAARMSALLSGSIAAAHGKELSLTHPNQPELLEALLAEQVPSLLTSLDATDCSGVFLTLVNPNLPGAAHSKAGLYIRNTEPNISGTGTETRLLLRGPSSLATAGNLNMQAEWDLEFDVTDQLFWKEPIAAYENDPSRPLSRLVYWCSMSPVQGLGEDVMVCSVPLLDANGDVLGVCGFEISEMNFMLRHMPDGSEFFNTVFIFSSIDRDGIRLEDALFSGNPAVYETFPAQGSMRGTGSVGDFVIYEMPGGAPLAGMEKAIRLYPDDSPFAERAFLASVVIPKADFDAAEDIVRLRFVLLLLMLLTFGIFASIFLSKRYMKPIMDKLSETGESEMPSKTNIAEIDLLIERFKAKNSPIPENLFDDFIFKVKTLTPAELVVFQSHAEGKSADEMAKSLFIAISTLKKHNSHIYEKLGVSSQDELRLYINLLKKCDMMERVFSDNWKSKIEA